MEPAAEIPPRALPAPDGGQENTSEAELVARPQQGDERAFATLFEFYNRRVYSLCLRMTRSAVEAEDLTQDALMLFFRKLPTFRGESTLATWLHRIVVNVVLMHLRKKRLQQVPLDEAEPGNTHLNASTARPTADWGIAPFALPWSGRFRVSPRVTVRSSFCTTSTVMSTRKSPR